MRPNPFFIATLARTGTHLLRSLFYYTGKVGSVREYLHRIRSSWKNYSDTEFLAYFDEIHKRALSEGESPTGHWGTKADVYEIPIIERYLCLKDEDPKDIKWIWLRRRDKLRQAISLIKARQTDIWALTEHCPPERKQHARASIEIPDIELYKYALCLYTLESVWEQYFKENRVKPHIIYYEDFKNESEWEPTIKGIFDYLEVPYSSLTITSAYIQQATNEMPENYKRFKQWLRHGSYTQNTVNDLSDYI